MNRVETFPPWCPAPTAAAVSRSAGRCCSRVQGLRLDQLKVDRVEDTGSFPLEIRTEGDTARLTDRQLDPGMLCPAGP